MANVISPQTIELTSPVSPNSKQSFSDIQKRMERRRAAEVSSAFTEIENRAGPPSLAILVVTSSEEVSRRVQQKVDAEITSRKSD